MPQMNGRQAAVNVWRGGSVGKLWPGSETGTALLWTLHRSATVSLTATLPNSLSRSKTRLHHNKRKDKSSN